MPANKLNAKVQSYNSNGDISLISLDSRWSSVRLPIPVKGEISVISLSHKSRETRSVKPDNTEISLIWFWFKLRYFKFVQYSSPIRVEISLLEAETDFRSLISNSSMGRTPSGGDNPDLT